MSHRVLFASVLIGSASVCAIGLVRAQSNSQPSGQPADRNGWTLPATAAEEKNPLAVNDRVLAAGKKLYASKCQRCHGLEGKGNGPDADKAHADDMNLTLAARAAGNPDGVVFYRIWNGRSSPKMPRFSEEISREQAWAIVAFVQTLRARQ